MEMSVKTVRLISEKTQREMAKAMNISRDTYRAIEKNPSKATIDQAKKISAITGFSVDSIFFGK